MEFYIVSGYDIENCEIIKPTIHHTKEEARKAINGLHCEFVDPDFRDEDNSLIKYNEDHFGVNSLFEVTITKVEV